MIRIYNNNSRIVTYEHSFLKYYSVFNGLKSLLEWMHNTYACLMMNDWGVNISYYIEKKRKNELMNPVADLGSLVLTNDSIFDLGVG